MYMLSHHEGCVGSDGPDLGHSDPILILNQDMPKHEARRDRWLPELVLDSRCVESFLLLIFDRGRCSPRNLTHSAEVGIKLSGPGVRQGPHISRWDKLIQVTESAEKS